MPLEIWIFLGLAAIAAIFGVWTALTTRDSWDRKPASLAGAHDEWDFHKATLGIY